MAKTRWNAVHGLTVDCVEWSNYIVFELLSRLKIADYKNIAIKKIAKEEIERTLDF